jgi:beta-glucosidase
VTVPLDRRSFAYYDVSEKRWRIAPGEFGILVGDSSATADLKSSITIDDSAAKAAVE